MLHSFGNGTDGLFPQAGLIDVNGTLYGTTNQGGTGRCNLAGYPGCGTVFEILARPVPNRYSTASKVGLTGRTVRFHRLACSK